MSQAGATHSTIEIHLNGDDRTVPAGLDVRGLIEHLGLRPELVVVELNRDILPRDAYQGRGVEEGDVIELVHFVGGG